MQRFALFCIVVAVAGCDRLNPVAGPPQQVAPVVENSLPIMPVKLELKSFDEFQALVASKKGKIVVVDAWSTYCDPCMKEFHGLVELHKRHGPDKLACISLCTNFTGKGNPADELEEPLTFLKSQNATFDNLFSTTGDNDLYKKLGIASIPAIFVYDRDGKLLKTFEREPTYAEVGKFVEPLVQAAN